MKQFLFPFVIFVIVYFSNQVLLWSSSQVLIYLRPQLRQFLAIGESQFTYRVSKKTWEFSDEFDIVFV